VEFQIAIDPLTPAGVYPIGWATSGGYLMPDTGQPAVCGDSDVADTRIDGSITVN